MPGARLASFREGDRSELLVELLLSAFAFTTRVPRQEDVGFDFFCSLITKHQHLLKAGPFFAVQAKSSLDAVVYEKEHELEWISTQENPLLLCVADRKSLSVDIYSTWNLICGPLARKATRITLIPGVRARDFPGVVNHSDGAQEIHLGDPILRISDDDVSDVSRRQQIGEVLAYWIALDRTNLVNRQAGIYWVLGPTNYETGQLPSALGGVAFYWNPVNLSQCAINLGRAGAALVLLLPEDHLWADRKKAIHEMISAYWELFDEPVRKILTEKGLAPTSRK